MRDPAHEDRELLPAISRPLVVELGSVGLSLNGESNSEKLVRSAKNHPKWDHVGIDLAQCTHSAIRHIQADFLNGLKKIPDGSASLIVSRFAVGYYTRKGTQLPIRDSWKTDVRMPEDEYRATRLKVQGYAQQIVGCCCKKLHPKGILYIQVCAFEQPLIERAAQMTAGVKTVKTIPHENPCALQSGSFWAKGLSIQYPIVTV